MENGVSNGLLDRLSKKMPKYKKYRIPATNNPFFTYQDYKQALRDYGGEEDERFQNLVLGRSTANLTMLISRDEMKIDIYPFYNYRYNAQDKLQGKRYTDKLELPELQGYELFIAALDTGFVDPTIINVYGLKNSVWYCVTRYKLQRIEFPEQEIIIDWLHSHFNFYKIAIDAGSGGKQNTAAFKLN